jgi:NAD(P)-dependent dehydrogenase (short-subunit alcohol dehydrogenase family)
VGALLAETLATRNVTVVVLTKDAPKYETQSGRSQKSPTSDRNVESINTYLCDVSDYDSVMSVAAKVRDEVRARLRCLRPHETDLNRWDTRL